MVINSSILEESPLDKTWDIRENHGGVPQKLPKLKPAFEANTSNQKTKKASDFHIAR